MKNKSSQSEQVARTKSAKTAASGKRPSASAGDKGSCLWHEVTDEEKQQIRQEAKSLLTEFATKLKKIKAKESHHENESGTRQEGTGWKTDEEFRSTTLANAPFVEDNFLVAEKGAWKK